MLAVDREQRPVPHLVEDAQLRAAGIALLELGLARPEGAGRALRLGLRAGQSAEALDRGGDVLELARLRSELAGLRAAGASDIGARRARVITQALESVYVVEPSVVDGRVAFGASVVVEDASGQRTSYEIVGPDEADPAARRISIEPGTGAATMPGFAR